MNRIKNIFLNIKIIYLYILIVILLLGLILSVIFILRKEEKIIEIPTEINSKCQEETENKETKKIKIDIKGNIVNPGVYEFEDNARVSDAINAAGGLLEDSDISLINLSKKLTDEMTIIIYSKKQIEDYKNNNKEIEYVYIEVEKCPDKINDACINDKKEEEITEDDNSLISINKANIEQLKSLTGIGESKAKDIISYREKNGPFNSIDEIKNVSGIGDTLFEKISSYITV